MGRITANKRWRCRACCEVTLEPGLLTAPSPFEPSDTLTACPRCKQCDEGFELLCDEPGCNVVAGCGWPTNNDADQWGGYRNTCGPHMRANALHQSPARAFRDGPINAVVVGDGGNDGSV